jgi:hypothetical protein
MLFGRGTDVIFSRDKESLFCGFPREILSASKSHTRSE